MLVSECNNTLLQSGCDMWHTHLMTGLEELSMSCSTVTAGVSSRVVTSFMLQMARAASTVTMSFLCLRQLSRKS